MSEVSRAIRDHISQHLYEGGSVGSLNDQTPLIDEEIIDSLGIFVLVEFLEDRFGVTLQPEDVVLENFQSVAAITQLVEQKLEGHG